MPTRATVALGYMRAIITGRLALANDTEVNAGRLASNQSKRPNAPDRSLLTSRERRPHNWGPR